MTYILFCTQCCVSFYDKCLAKIQIQCRAFFFSVHWRDPIVVPGSWVMHSMKSIEKNWQIWDNLIESETKFSELLWRVLAKLNDVRRRNWCMMLLWRCRNWLWGMRGNWKQLLKYPWGHLLHFNNGSKQIYNILTKVSRHWILIHAGGKSLWYIDAFFMQSDSTGIGICLRD